MNYLLLFVCLQKIMWIKSPLINVGADPSYFLGTFWFLVGCWSELCWGQRRPSFAHHSFMRCGSLINLTSFIVWLAIFRLANNIDGLVRNRTTMFCTFASHFTFYVVVWAANTVGRSSAIGNWGFNKRILVILQDWSAVSQIWKTCAPFLFIKG